MKEKVIVVSGANGNLGHAVVQYFLENGNKVIGLVHRKSQNPLIHHHYEELIVDISNENEALQCVNEIENKYDCIDIAIMTVGGFAMGHIADTGIDRMKQQYKLNFETAYNLTKPVLALMLKQGEGKIFFTGSIAGMNIKKAKGVIAYGLSKSLLFNLAHLINMESNNSGVFAHVIVPSIIDTPQNRADMPNADFSKWEKPEQIAQVIGKYAENKSDQVEIVIQEEI